MKGVISSNVFLPTLITVARQVLEELVGDQSLERFRVEYEKIHRALKKSHGAHRSASCVPLRFLASSPFS